jgi:predicted transcriptional regulator of viral defense system
VSFRTKDLVESHVFGFGREPTDDRESVLIFDLERSLLNTLTDPACNGGGRAVIQAWENAVDRLRPERLLDYLRRLNRPALWRRVGALAAAFDLSDLAGTVGEVVAELPRLEAPLPLIWNQKAGTLLAPWSVLVPW